MNDTVTDRLQVRGPLWASLVATFFGIGHLRPGQPHRRAKHIRDGRWQTERLKGMVVPNPIAEPGERGRFQ